MKDRVTLEPAAEDYARRCKSIGLERKDVADLQDAMNHPEFKSRHHLLLDDLATEYRRIRPLIERPGQELLLGVRKSAEEMRRRLITKGCQIGNWGCDILNCITLVSSPTKIKVVEVSNAELGYPGGCTVAQTYKAGLNLGWDLCEHEVGPEYLLQDLDLPKGKYLRIAMKPIADSDGRLEVFSVDYDGDGQRLHGDYGRPEDFYYGGSIWLFRRK